MDTWVASSRREKIYNIIKITSIISQKHILSKGDSQSRNSKHGDEKAREKERGGREGEWTSPWSSGSSASKSNRSVSTNIK